MWDCWSPNGVDSPDSLITCTIITCPANDLVARVHERMPVILTGEQAWEWLENDNQAALFSILKPAPMDLLQAWGVGQAVNDPKNDSPACVEPVKTEETIL